MKKNLYILFLFFSIFSFGQIGDPTPDLDFEPSYQDNGKPGDKWDFSKKPYKKIKTITANVVVDEFDSVGRYTSRSVFWNHFTDSTTKKYKDDMLVEFTRKKIYNRDEKESKTYQDEIETTKLNVTNKGRIIDGEIFTLTNDSIYKVTGHQYYDKKNRLIKIAYSEGLGEINFYYSGENLIRKEQIDIIDSKTKIVRDKTYKYNKDNQIVFHETVKSIFVNNTLTEKKNTYTVHQEFKDKLLVKKILKDESETIERNYTYDNNKNVINFIEIKKIIMMV